VTHLFLDATRVATRIFRSAPTGIDRVEYAYATEILGSEAVDDAIGVITTPLFSGALPHACILDLLDRVARAWGLDKSPSEDAVYRAIRAWIESPIAANSARSIRFRGASTLDLITQDMILPLRDIAAAKHRLRKWTSKQADGRSTYLHTSHTQLDHKTRFAWLKPNSVRSCFFIHDVIPIDYPEFCSPGALGKHVARLRTVSDMASLILVNSDFTAQRVKEHLARHALHVPNIAKIPLGVDEWFLRRDDVAPPATATPYFLCIGTIEPRKNLTFLLAVWRRLVERMGPRAPRLILAGRRGWENENVIDLLERSHALGPHVAEVSDLTDAGLASLIAGATAVVAPSLIEGFGLPLAESLALGAPVLASDIPAHREVAGGFADFLDPLDGPAWVEAIEAFCAPESPNRAAALTRVKAYRPMLWRDHVGQALTLLRNLDSI
jgi:glycosyltransferase involved in cell wall biosynthesis